MFAIITLIISTVVGVGAYNQSTSKMNESRVHIPISGTIMPDMSTTAKAIEKASKVHGIIQLNINSGGGSIQGGTMIVDAMLVARREYNTTFVCVGEGVVASMAFIIFSMCDERYSMQDTQYLTHLPFHMYQGFMIRVVLTSEDHLRGYKSLKASEDKYFPIVRRVFRVTDPVWKLLNDRGGMLLRPRVVQAIAPTFLDSCIDEKHENVPCEPYRAPRGF